MNDRSQGYGLSLHTSSGELGLAISDFQGPPRCQTWNLQKELSNYLHQYLCDFLAPQTWHDIDFLAVAIGPGSFTSIRLGVVTARILAQQLNLPLYGISTLAAFAWSKREAESRYLAIQMPATRGKLSVGIYEVNEEKIETYLPDKVMEAGKWEELLETLPVDYTLLYTPQLLGINSLEILSLAHKEKEKGKISNWQEVLPFYGMTMG